MNRSARAFTLSLICALSFLQSQAQENEFPYKRSKKDLILIPTGILSFITAEHLSNERDHNLTMDEISSLDRMDVNRFDRNATYHRNTSADGFSDVVNKVMPLAPMALAIPQLANKKWDNTATLGIMYIEVFLFTKGLTGITKSLVGRTRPYLYNTSFTVEERFNLQSNGAPVASTSFFSGHSSSTFAFAVFLSKTYTDIYGKGTWSKIIWCTSLTLASATAYSRVAAGEHFPTDVIVGAMVGSAIGYVIPVLHKVNPEKLSLQVLPNCFSVVYKF
jgi:hypothetical protein